MDKVEDFAGNLWEVMSNFFYLAQLPSLPPKKELSLVLFFIAGFLHSFIESENHCARALEYIQLCIFVQQNYDIKVFSPQTAKHATSGGHKLLLHPGDKDTMKIIHLTGEKDVKGAVFSDQVIKSQTKELCVFMAENKYLVLKLSIKVKIGRNWCQMVNNS